MYWLSELADMVWLPIVRTGGVVIVEAELGVNACVLVPITACVPLGDNDILVPETVTTPPGVNVCDPMMY